MGRLLVPGMALLFVLLAFLMARGVWRSLEKGLAPRYDQRAAASVAAFGLFDLAWLLLLPALGLSYGWPYLSTFVFLITRLAVLCAFPAPLKYGARLHPPLLGAPTRRLAVSAIWAINGLLAALLVYGTAIEPFNVQATQVTVSGPDLLLNGRPLRILHISDLHVERLTRREARVLELAERLQPDLILLTGDYVNLDYMYDRETWQQTRQWVAQLHAPYGVYAISGSVDAPEARQAIFDGLDVQMLDDDRAVISLPGGKLNLVGVADIHWATPRGDWAARARAMQKLMLKASPADHALAPGGFTIVLHHTPDLIEAAAAQGADLYLAGHTHGGQICLPFYGAVVTASNFGKKYEGGVYQLGEMTGIVSRGLGMEGAAMPRIRFLAPPEVILIEVGPAD